MSTFSPCTVCKLPGHSELACPNVFDSAANEEVLLRQIRSRNPDFTHAEALEKVNKYMATDCIRPRAGTEVEENEPSEELHEKEIKPNVSSYDELFPSRRRDAPKAEESPHPPATAPARHAIFLGHKIPQEKAPLSLVQRSTSTSENLKEAKHFSIGAEAFPQSGGEAGDGSGE